MTDAFSDQLALAVDERVLALDPCPDPARLFGIRLRGDGFSLVPFWSGAAREIPVWLAPPDGCVGIVLDSAGWAAPLDADGSVTLRPSQHPRRRRMHQTCVVHGDDGTDVTVLRQDGDPPQVMRGGIGFVLDLMRACWANRRERVGADRGAALRAPGARLGTPPTPRAAGDRDPGR